MKKAPWTQFARVRGPEKKPRRKYLRARSPRMEWAMRLYRRKREVFLKANRWCAVYPYRHATTVHHIRGRLGPLLLNQRYWLPVSLEGHMWIDQNRDEARLRGWLARKGDWNKSPKQNQNL